MQDNRHQDCVDLREALYNDRAVGPITSIQLPTVRITQLHGILFDLDPHILKPGNPIFPPADCWSSSTTASSTFLPGTLARFAEVRVSGTGLHLILWMQPAVQLLTEMQQNRWGTIVKAVQLSLPIDPDMPGITAVTRSVNSLTSKNGAVVTTLCPGEPVSPELVEQFMTSLD